MKKIILGLLIVILIALMGAAAYLWTPEGRTFDAEAAREVAKQYDARIIRDDYGVPHVFGKTDADAHFGFAYAHAEDAWEIMEETLMAGRGMAAQYRGQVEAPADYLYDLFRVEQVVAQGDLGVPEDVRAIIQAYVAGLNLFGAEHPERVTPGLLPVTEDDIHAAVMWLTPFFYRLDGYLEPLFSETDAPQVSPWQQTSSLELPHAVVGSNGFAVAPSRSEDGHTRLIVNSHQPMNGRYAWYEIHLVSEEGLNIFGGTFPGTPVIPQGITPNTAWTHTVNRPDLVDIYKLVVDDEKDPQQYQLDGEWKDFDRGESRFRVKLWGPFSLPVKRDALWSDHGPVLSTPNGHFALRFAGLGETAAVEQWYRMGRAQNLEMWRNALNINGVLSFNIVYGDRDGNIGTIYNGRIPNRIEGPDWSGILPGDDSRLIWEGFRPVSDLPQHWNPDCGWLFSA
ncbi:MAG: penicillin acylase family protein, partial [Pseudomonadota bacterium]